MSDLLDFISSLSVFRESIYIGLYIHIADTNIDHTDAANSHEGEVDDSQNAVSLPVFAVGVVQ